MTTTVETFASFDPATGKELARYPIHDAGQVRAAVDRARVGGTWWAGLAPAERRRRMRAWAAELVRTRHTLAALIHDETGKPHDDAFLELLLGLEHIAWASPHAARVLRRRRLPSGLAMANHAAYVEYRPFGVVGVIGPWNYPVFTPLGSIAYALAAGNTVLFKPSEHTSGVGVFLADAFARANPDAMAGVFEVVTGGGSTGAALCGAGVDKLAFTGSGATGTRVMTACARTLTPVLMECGGKDALIVGAGANVKEAAEAALWGALSNAGQTCVGIERVFVERSIRAEFLDELRAGIADLIPPDEPGGGYGPMTVPTQMEVVRRHIDEALAGGATALVGGIGAVRPPYIDPVVLVDAPDDSGVACEETFGPVIAVRTVEDLDEAVRLANGTGYGLGAAVFARTGRLGVQVARRLRTGMVSVDAVIAFASIPALPFGGVGASGFGRIHGADGLREFARPQSITRRLFRTPIEPTSFARTRGTMKLLDRYVALRFGRRA
ncbi:aldehyde dehydrogenase family protein [Embleya sp. NPDC020886]|uniref:aldehyde dehydrogenase family protein n=1 Tax=Embleya sp. NPDC020886 TaxID=3363980 RepID=UPI0037B6B69C